MTGRKFPLTPQEVKAMDRDPKTAAVMVADYAPATFSAVVSLYCEMLEDEYAASPPGRHTVNAELRGDRL